MSPLTTEYVLVPPAKEPENSIKQLIADFRIHRRSGGQEVGDVGSKTTWQLRQNSEASVIRYLKMNGDLSRE
jgi:hypothetical protein